ncbi:MAG: FAD-binding and (Fe-S)-binding domain-containing protein [Streptosporangiaceae bacterium]
MTTDTGSLERRLRATVDGDVAFDAGARGLYAQDASNYRHVPLGVVLPRSADDVVATVAACRDHGVPLVSRGGGTSIAGNSTGDGVVLDASRHFNRILEIDPDRRVARVEPGVVLDDLRAAAGAYGLTFGPDPSTHSRCTIGGMLGNNSCGAHSVAWGKTVDNVDSLDVLLYDGTRLTVGPTSRKELEQRAASPGRAGTVHAALRDLVDDNLALLRTGFPQFPRRVSGYGLDQLLPENDTHLARALVGTEGTCATVLGATLRLVPTPGARALLVLGFPDDVAAAEAAPRIVPYGPLAVEGLDERIVAISQARPGRGVDLPEGRAWLFVEVGGDDAAEALDRAREIETAVRRAAMSTRVVVDPAAQRSLWRVREEGAGLSTRLPDGSEAWPGWEDAAVPPERLADYLRDFWALMRRHDLRGLAYGHFGEGCIHIRIDFDLLTPHGIKDFRGFMTEAADCVVAHGGSLSGEHGDGQSRSELLDRMYGRDVLRLFERFKGIFDPDDRMNPGVLVRPRRIDDDLRFAALPVAAPATTFAYHADGGSFAQAMRRCVGVGKCRAKSGGVMCPSYRATRDEKHSTRGRARLLFEMLSGDVVTDGWRSEQVMDALDLCLACKGCKNDCPVGVDMATYKAEFLHHHYAGKMRPLSHYSMGFLPLWARLAALAPDAVNAAARSPVSPLAKRVAGVAPARELPVFSRATFAGAFRSRERRSPSDPTRPAVALWPDTFTNFLAPEIGVAAVRVLEDAGFRVVVPRGPVCCGLTWVSTGQLGAARRVMRGAVRALEPYVNAEVPIVGLEPSCTAALRDDLPELVDDGRAASVARATSTLASFLADRAPGWRPGRRLDRSAITQVHCHQHAVLGYAAEEELLRRAGVENETLDAGCCGLAGNFGFEREHYDVSMACAEDALLPTVRAASDDTVVIADGFSCRTQVAHGTGRGAMHLAQVLAMGLTRL